MQLHLYVGILHSSKAGKKFISRLVQSLSLPKPAWLVSLPSPPIKIPAESGYRVYLNKYPHRPKEIGCTLLFQSKNFKTARHFAKQMLRTSAEWLVEDWNFFQASRNEALIRFQKFVDNFWIEPIGNTQPPPLSFCSRREASKLLKSHPEIFAAARKWLLEIDRQLERKYPEDSLHHEQLTAFGFTPGNPTRHTLRCGCKTPCREAHHRVTDSDILARREIE